jgi:hypothetical protein
MNASLSAETAAPTNSGESHQRGGSPHDLIDMLVRDHLGEVFNAAVKAYAARAESAGGAPPPPVDKTQVTATEVVVVATALIRAVDLNLFDVAMWFRRPVPGAHELTASASGVEHG